MAVSDDGLIAGMAAGDAEATAAFVRRYQARVFGLALSVVGVPAVAEDVVQEAFVRAWRLAGCYDPRRGPVAGWLLAITRNAAIDARRLARDRSYDPHVLVELAAGPDGSDGYPDRLAEVQRVHDGLARLPREQVVAVVLAAVFAPMPHLRALAWPDTPAAGIMHMYVPERRTVARDVQVGNSKHPPWRERLALGAWRGGGRRRSRRPGI